MYDYNRLCFISNGLLYFLKINIVIMNIWFNQYRLQITLQYGQYGCDKSIGRYNYFATFGQITCFKRKDNSIQSIGNTNTIGHRVVFGKFLLKQGYFFS